MHKVLTLLTPLTAVAMLLSACGSSSSGGSTSAHGNGASAGTASSASSSGASGAVVVKTAEVPSLHTTALVDGSSMTLYRLSGEGAGKFICTSAACLQVWHPVTVAAGGKARSSIRSLGTIKRPDGATQVTFEGGPLYTFAQDTKPGEASGQGLKDVGTWTAATTGRAASPATTPAGGGTSTKSMESPSESSSSGGGGGYGY